MVTEREIPWGVVQQLSVEADTDSSLKAALTIAMSYNSTVSHFRVEVQDGSPVLRLLWHGDQKPETQLFLSPMKTPEQVLAEVRRWLDAVGYPPDKYRGDGSTKKGFRVELDHCGWNYTVCLIKPTWIIYSK